MLQEGTRKRKASNQNKVNITTRHDQKRRGNNSPKMFDWIEDKRRQKAMLQLAKLCPYQVKGDMNQLDVEPVSLEVFEDMDIYDLENRIVKLESTGHCYHIDTLKKLVQSNKRVRDPVTQKVLSQDELDYIHKKIEEDENTEVYHYESEPKDLSLGKLKNIYKQNDDIIDAYTDIFKHSLDAGFVENTQGIPDVNHPQGLFPRNWPNPRIANNSVITEVEVHDDLKMFRLNIRPVKFVKIRALRANAPRTMSSESVEVIQFMDDNAGRFLLSRIMYIAKKMDTAYRVYNFAKQLRNIDGSYMLCYDWYSDIDKRIFREDAIDFICKLEGMYRASKYFMKTTNN